MPRGRLEAISKRLQDFALTISMLGLAATFGIFIYSIVMRHAFGRPQSWTDEAVSISTAWLVFWASAFVLKWSEFISFDVVYALFPRHMRRWVVMTGALIFVGVFGAALWQLTDFVMFMSISTTSMLQIPLDRVYGVFILFIVVICARLLILCFRLAFGDSDVALRDLEALPEEASR